MTWSFIRFIRKNREDSIPYSTYSLSKVLGKYSAPLHCDQELSSWNLAGLYRSRFLLLRRDYEQSFKNVRIFLHFWSIFLVLITKYQLVTKTWLFQKYYIFIFKKIILLYSTFHWVNITVIYLEFWGENINWGKGNIPLHRKPPFAYFIGGLLCTTLKRVRKRGKGGPHFSNV